jgi:hypothetical protein
MDVDDFLAWAYLLERAHLVLVAQEEFAGTEAGAVAIGTTPVAIAGRVLTLLGDDAVYMSLCAAPDLDIPREDGCAPVLEALAGLRAPPPLRAAPHALGEPLNARAAS